MDIKDLSLSISKDLIRINSENLGSNEVEIVKWCRNLLATYGIETRITARDPMRPSLIAVCQGKNPGRKLIFQSHLDTKPAAHAGTSIESWTSDPFEPRFENGRMYGLGACDTKSGAAAQLAVLIHYATHGLERGELVWQGVADEEHGSWYGAEYLLESGELVADGAVVAEPSDAVPTFSQLGSVWCEINITGAAAHGGTPWRGRDAIAAGLKLTAYMEQRLREFPHDKRFCGHPALGVRQVGGGSHPGTVASSCQLVCDVRVPPGLERQEVSDAWLACAAKVEGETGVSIEIVPSVGGGCESNEITTSSPLAIAAGRAWHSAFDEELQPGVFFGGSDARYFAKASTPCIVFGPGSLEVAHSPDEFVPVSEIGSSAMFLRALVQTFLID